MKTYLMTFYDKIIGKCDDFAKSCTQDEIVVTISILIVSGVLALWLIW